MVAHAPTLFTEDTDTVGLIDHDRAIVLMLQFDDFWQFGKVALHREDAIDHDEFDGFLRQFLEHTLEILHVVVLVVQLLGKGETASIDNRSMVAIVANHEVVLAQQSRDDALIYGETCREAEAIVLTDVFGNLLFELNVQVERSVEETASGTTRAILVECSLSCIDDTLVASQTRIGIRAEHQHLVTTHLNLRSLLSFNSAEIRIHVGFHKLLRFTVVLVSFL